MIEFIKTRNVKNPERNANENAGIDFFVPEFDSFSDEELKDIGAACYNENFLTIIPHSSVVIPLGVMSKFDKNLALIAFNKSGIVVSKQLTVGACVIDSSYQGEWKLNLINTSNQSQIINFGQKIIQFVPLIINNDDIVVKNQTAEEFFKETSNRGNGGFGSTGV